MAEPAHRSSWGYPLSFLAFCSLPALLLWTLWKWLPNTWWLRWSVILIGMLGAYALAHAWWRERRWFEITIFSGLGIAFWFQVLSYLGLVTSYPFGLYWSEGNRFYDYSLVFGKSLYQSQYPILPLYNEPGRYALWGILFAVPDLSIWVHRLWNAILWVAPLLILGYLIARWSEIRFGQRLVFVVWVFLFLMQGPIYPSLVVSALLVVASSRWKSLGLRLGIVFLAGYYAALSRWTWMVAPAAWGAILVLLWEEYDPAQSILKWLPVRKKTLVEAFLLAVGGVIGGMLAKPGLFFATQEATGFALKQPLLWYRWFPNATNPTGILLGIVLAAGPLLALLAWLIWRRLWRLSWVQLAAALVPGLVFLAIGLVASVKIGGGSNLHNLDMFLITLVILAGLALRVVVNKEEVFHITWTPAWRRLAQFLLVLVLLFPAISALSAGSPLQLPGDKVVQEALQVIQSEASQAQQQGEVLFMDQRQLLAFGDIRDVMLVPGYEKKFMMDQSMAGNPDSFIQFYRDLADHRFALIVSGILKVDTQGSEHNFGEENDAWDKWVARALLCYYKPKTTLKAVHLQLLVPRASPGEDCP